MTSYLSITARDPLVARDGRPFGAGQGNRMRSSGWLSPSVVAGSFRTTLAKASDRGFDAATQDELLKIDVGGVLPLVGGQLVAGFEASRSLLWWKPLRQNAASPCCCLSTTS